MQMVNLLVDMTRRFKLMKTNNDNSMRYIALIAPNAAFDTIKKNLIEIKYYSRDFYKPENFFTNIFIGEDDKGHFLNIFKSDDTLIFD